MPTGTSFRIPLAVYVLKEEKETIDNFFSNHPALKKGETVKQWILRAIEAERAIESGKTQIDVRNLERRSMTGEGR